MSDDDKIARFPPPAWMSPDWLPTGEALIDEWMKRHGANYRWLDAEGQWYAWTGSLWKIDEVRSVNVKAAQLCRDIGAEKKRSMRMKLEHIKTVTSITARAKDQCALESDAFNHHDMINCGDAEYLGRKVVSPHVREHLHSKIAAVSGPSADECPMWRRHLKRITGGDEELMRYLQRVAGYCCSASTAEQVLFFLYGTGKNGKSVFVSTISGILNDYATTASIDVFLSSKFDRHPEELAAFRGVRLVVASEAAEGRAWNETMIKQATGGEKIRARFMRQNSFEYLPLFKIMVAGNHKPALHSTNEAIRRRFHVIPFTIEIPEADRILDFSKKLQAEWPQIFAWMLDGWDEWMRIGLAPPESVLQATSEYISAQDVRADWIEERCDRMPDAVTPTSELFADWKVYAEARGEYVGSMKSLTEDLKGRGFLTHRSNTVRGFKGIMIKPSMQGTHNSRYGD